MFELQVLAASFTTRQVMSSLLSCSASCSDLTTRLTLREAYEYLQRDPLATHVDPDTLKGLVASKLASNQLEKLNIIMERASKLTVSTPNVQEIDRLGRLNEWADSLITELGRSDRRWDAIHDVVQSYSSIQVPVELSPVTFDRVQEYTDNGRKIWTGIKNLDAMLGDGLRAGHQVLIYSRPEIGKSLLSLNIAKGLAEQGLRGIYFENEEPAEIASQRLLCAITKRRLGELSNLSVEAKRKAESVSKNVVIHQLTPGTLGEIETLSQGYDWIIVNQIRNLKYKESNKVVALEELAKGVRGVAARNKLLAISVTQAGDSAEGKRVLTLGDVDFSNTGIPSQMDVMIGIGANQEDEENNFRMLSLPKNKTGGGHGRCVVEIDPARSLIL